MEKYTKTLVIAMFIITLVLGGFLMVVPQAFAADESGSKMTNADFMVDSILLPQAIKSEKAIQALALHPMTGFGGPEPAAEGSFFGPAPVGGFAPPTITSISEEPLKTSKRPLKTLKDASDEHEISLFAPPPVVNMTQVAQDRVERS